MPISDVKLHVRRIKDKAREKKQGKNFENKEKGKAKAHQVH